MSKIEGIPMNLQLFAEGEPLKGNNVDGQTAKDGNSQGTGEDKTSEGEVKGGLTEEQVKAMLEAGQAKILEDIKREQKEAKKLSKMSEEEKKAFENDKKLKVFEERESRLKAKELEFEVKNLLVSEGLQTDLLKLVQGEDVEATKENIKLFKETVDAEVSKQVQEKLKGRTPSGQMGAGGSFETQNAMLEAMRRGLR